MEKIKRILMITSEVLPYAKTGGLADMVNALAQELKNKNYDVRILLPLYSSINKEKLKFHKEDIYIPTGIGEKMAGLYEDRLVNSIPVYFIENHDFFDRSGIYSDEQNKAYVDNAERFNFLCQSAFQVCRYLQWIPQIMHCHDWATGLIPLYLNTSESFREFESTASLFTIHNLAYQGIFSLDDLKYIGLLENSALIHEEKMNFLKCAIEQSHIITTVSPQYSKEIQTKEFGESMNIYLKKRSSDIYGILNGVDYREWNPEHDAYIHPHNYTIDTLERKSLIKEKIQILANLKVDPKIPLIGIVSRLVEQKGFKELCDPQSGVLKKICEDMNLQFLVIGTGEKWCENELIKLDKNLSNIKVWTVFDNSLAHLIEAGSDFFLMASRYEPCGLNQMYSLKYGTLPIVRDTGGLSDTVEDYNKQNGSGTGFKFKEMTPSAIYKVIERVLQTWNKNKNHIDKMRKNAMIQDFSWNESLLHYEDAYVKALEKRLKGSD